MKKNRISKILCVLMITTLMMPGISAFADSANLGDNITMSNGQQDGGSTTTTSPNGSGSNTSSSGGGSGTTQIKNWGNSSSNPVISYLTINPGMLGNSVNQITSQSNGIIEYEYHSPTGEIEYRKIYYPVDTKGTSWTSTNTTVVDKHYTKYKWTIKEPNKNSSEQVIAAPQGESLTYTFKSVGHYEFTNTPYEYVKEKTTVTRTTQKYVIYADGSKAITSSNTETVSITYDESKSGYRTNLTKRWKYDITPEEIGEHKIPDDSEDPEDIDIDVQLIR